MQTDYLIIGAGITGVTFARFLQKSGRENFCILEKNNEPGGLCRSKTIAGHELDLGGGHFFCTKYPEVYDFVFSHIPKEEFHVFPRVSKINLEGNIIDYPVESNIWQLPEELQKKYLHSITAAGSMRGNEAPRHYLDWLRWRLGDRISNQYMIPYNQKIWGVDPSVMDIDWLDKIPRLSVEEIKLSIENRVSNRAKMPSHETFYYPKTGGFQKIFDAICSNVKEHIVLNTAIERIEQIQDGWRVNDLYDCKAIINTAPWPSLFSALNPPEHLHGDFRRLHANSIVVSLIEADYHNDFHWIYEPAMAIAHHREFFIHNFAPQSKANGIYVETNKNRWQKGAAVGKYGKIPLYEHLNDTAYPIPTLEHAKAIDAIRNYYGARGLHGLGRWGQWKYFNSDVCIREVMEFMKKELGTGVQM